MTDLPSGTVTFLFTDLVGSTKLWEHRPAAMPDALQRHDTIIQTAVTAHAGRLFKTTGDGCLAAFTNAGDAIAAAVEAQSALQSEDWRQGDTASPLEAIILQSRMAIHTGAVEQRDGDYFGAPMNRAARLMAVAHGGQILLSLATAELAQEQLPPRVALIDLGVHQLRDLGRPERIFQVVAPGLLAAFPPLCTLDRAPHNLPAQPTPLVGREWELANVCSLLRRDTTRLVTLTGPGGTGKTRLSLQVAAKLAPEFADGAHFVDLAPVGAHLVASTIARSLGLREAAGQPLAEQIAAYLCAQELLLVLDNFEHVLEAVPLVANLLAAAPRLRVLVTSRAPLRLSAESEFAVPPLQLPVRSQALSIERLCSYEAVRLFVQRVQSVRSDFVVTPDNATAVAEICHRLDGLPLAIELAAARIRLFPPAALLERLRQPLAVLTAGARDLPQRQQTLRGAIDWSYRLLTADEQVLFRQLAVFVGGFTVAAAEGVCSSDTPAFHIVDGLASLVDHSLLRSVDGAGGEARLSMLETLREYALERLASDGEPDLLRRRHAEYYQALSEAVEPALRGPAQVVWLARLEEEHDNIRAVLAWCRTHNPQLGLRMAAALWPFWEIRGHMQEGRAWLAELLGLCAEAPGQVRAGALHGAGVLAFQQSDYRQASVLLAESHALFERLGNVEGTSYVLRSLGLVAWFQGDHGAARTHLERSVTLYRDSGLAWGIADSLHYLGHVLLDLGELDSARAVFDESLALFRTTGDTRNTALPLKDLGLIASQHGDYELAERLYEESLALSRAVSDILHVTDTLWRLGDLARLRGDAARAEELYSQCLDGHQKLGNRGGTAEALNLLGEAAQLRREYTQARRYHEESLQIQREIGSKRMVAAVLRNLGRVACHEGDEGRALSLYAESLNLNASIDYVSGVADCLVGLASLAVTRGRPERAARLLSAAEPHLNAVRGFMPLADRAQFDHAVAMARATLGPPAFEVAWEAGRSLDIRAAIALALADSDAPDRPAPAAAPTPSPPAYPAQLTQREAEVLRLVAQGLTDAQVAERLMVSPRTVHGHLRSIYGKLGVTSRTGAARFAIDHHLA